MKEAARETEYITEPSLYLAFELSKEEWARSQLVRVSSLNRLEQRALTRS
jgi:hypothetical protein